MKLKPLSRRKLLFLTAAIPVLGAANRLSFADELVRRTVTPRQTEGPFYPRRKPSDVDNDLAVFGNSEDLAVGDLLTLKGRVIDRQGNAISGARVELWHCDHLGQYHHVDAEGPSDTNFQGYGELTTNEAGSYNFRTVKPGKYPGRARHIHFKVIAAGRSPLTSQMYFDDETDSNMRDGIYKRLSVKERTAVTIEIRSGAQGENTLEGLLDIVLA
ncbi:MAG: hypothetical protein JKY60_15870 [Kordiimonadaceae bacterium]|nr:hypothetical protein [Kordiimonadaceae bacterium]